MDLKLFSKILAERLAPHLQKLIHYDQIGFLQGREARDGTIRAIDIIYKTQKSKKEYAFYQQTPRRHLITLIGNFYFKH